MLKNGLLRFFLAGGADLGRLTPVDAEAAAGVSPLAIAYKPSVLDVFPLPSDPLQEQMCRSCMANCFPDGMRIYLEPTGLAPKFHTFFYYWDEGTYGAALVFYERRNNARTEWGEYPVLYLPRCLCVVFRLPHYESMQQCLYALHDSQTQALRYPVEYYISSLALELPLVSADRACELRLPFLTRIIRFALPGPSDLPLLEFRLEDLFLCFSKRSVLELIFLLLLENRVWFFSSRIDRLNFVCHSLIALLYPFKWVSPASKPLLSYEELGYLGVPTPCLYGMLTDHFVSVYHAKCQYSLAVDPKRKLEVDPDAMARDFIEIEGMEDMRKARVLVIVNIDTGTVSAGKDALKPPQCLLDDLFAALEPELSRACPTAAPIPRESSAPSLGQQLHQRRESLADLQRREHSVPVLLLERQDEPAASAATVAIRGAFLDMFVRLFGMYREGISAAPEGETALLNKDVILAQHPVSWREFFSSFFATNIWEVFVASHIQPHANAFDRSILSRTLPATHVEQLPTPVAFDIPIFVSGFAGSARWTDFPLLKHDLLQPPRYPYLLQLSQQSDPLFFDAYQRLADEGSVYFSSGTLHEVPSESLAQPSDRLLVFVIVEGRMIPLQMQADDSAWMLKCQLHASAPAAVHLFTEHNVELENHLTLSDCNLRSGCILQARQAESDRNGRPVLFSLGSAQPSSRQLSRQSSQISLHSPIRERSVQLDFGDSATVRRRFSQFESELAALRVLHDKERDDLQREFEALQKENALLKQKHACEMQILHDRLSAALHDNSRLKEALLQISQVSAVFCTNPS
eukprot:gnl/Hemi2/3232_TR1136_c0_g3_i1.p1 gnl/Hemi2/3232_TR1136_c0_g3~~gnl/Hemi2/3232_TR1136_c0_g3_i1.p1  ORF type:complete len:804 (+),score=69.17 gnl/Hemi2/3232_TR1136_c0_g3_i1:157-2568(+)